MANTLSHMTLLKLPNSQNPKAIGFIHKPNGDNKFHLTREGKAWMENLLTALVGMGMLWNRYGMTSMFSTPVSVWVETCRSPVAPPFDELRMNGIGRFIPVYLFLYFQWHARSQIIPALTKHD